MGNLTLLDYMTQSDTSITVTLYKVYTQGDIGEIVKETSRLCGNFTVYLSYIYKGSVHNDDMDCMEIIRPLSIAIKEGILVKYQF